MSLALILEERRLADRREASRKYYIKNREHIISRNTEYRENNKEHITNQQKIYNKTPAGIKSKCLSNWKARGITFGEMTPSMYYDVIYLPTLKCMACDKTFNNINKNDKKCNDHANHLTQDDPLFLCNVRGVICFQCNVMDMWKKRLTPESIYNQYLH